MTDELLSRQQNEAKYGTVCPFVRAESNVTASWLAFSEARMISVGGHLLEGCLLPVKAKHTKL
jgi:hypothetical protein